MAIPVLGWVALAGLNAALAASKAAQARKQRKMEADIRAAEIEAAPWTGKAPTTQISTPTSNIWAELAGSGINTLGQGAALQGAGLFKESADTAMETASEALSDEDIMNLATQNQTLMPPSMPTMAEAFDPSQQASFLNPLQSKQNLWMQMSGR